jgi:2-polyprenyl-3-methyl-5-hydroxy-6-metoxy-1,4-benzoquinol methylase
MPEISKGSPIRNVAAQAQNEEIHPGTKSVHATGSGHEPKPMKPHQKQSIHSYNISKYAQASTLPSDFKIERGETQRNVNYTVLKNLFGRIPADAKVLDLPCGSQLFLGYLKELYPSADLTGADIMEPEKKEGIQFVKMDLTKEFEMPRQEQFDLISSISGVMMFSNTQSFIENCCARLKKDGLFVVTNDNSMTIMDRMRYLLFGRVRMFSPIYEDHEAVTQNVPVMELVRLLRTNGIHVEKIQYTSFYRRDLLFLPLALLVYPIQYLYLMRIKSSLPNKIKAQAYPFAHLLKRHYVIIGKKR